MNRNTLNHFNRTKVFFFCDWLEEMINEIQIIDSIFIQSYAWTKPNIFRSNLSGDDLNLWD